MTVYGGWVLIAKHLKISLTECIEKHSHRQYQFLLDYFTKEEENEFMLRVALSPLDEKAKKDIIAKMRESKLTEEQKLLRTKMVWAGRLGGVGVHSKG